MKRFLLLLIVLTLAVVPFAVHAHILKLKDGRILKGEFVRATSDVVYFNVEGDTVHEFSVGDILSIHFSSASIDAAAPPASEPVRIIPGTVLKVKLTAELGTRNSDAGQRYFAEMAEDLVVDGVPLSATGKRVFGRVRKVVKPKRPNDKAVVEILLTDLTIAGKSQPVVTNYFGVQADGKGNYTFLGTARPVGATLVEFFDDQHIRIPIGTVIEFRITQPVTVRHVKR